MYPDVEARCEDKTWSVCFKDEGRRFLISSGFRKIINDLGLEVGTIVRVKIVNCQPFVINLSKD